jgi:hypothetical protein
MKNGTRARIGSADSAGGLSLNVARRKRGSRAARGRDFHSIAISPSPVPLVQRALSECLCRESFEDLGVSKTGHQSLIILALGPQPHNLSLLGAWQNQPISQ